MLKRQINGDKPNAAEGIPQPTGHNRGWGLIHKNYFRMGAYSRAGLIRR